MSSVYGEEASQCGDDQGSGAHEEKIFVAVRLRPLNEREIANNDVSDWECINNTTILYKNALSERSLFPTACAYGKFFLFPSFLSRGSIRNRNSLSTLPG